MISIDIDGPSTMLNSICESIVITQGTVYSSAAPKPSPIEPVHQPMWKNVFDHRESSLSRLRHVVVDQHEEYLLDSSRTPTPSKKKDKVEIIDTWQDRTVIEGGSSSVWRSPALQTHRATKHVDSSAHVEQFSPPAEGQVFQTRYVPSHDVKHRTSEQIPVPSTFNWNEDHPHTPIRAEFHSKTEKQTRDIALSPILPEQLSKKTSSTSPIPRREKVDRSCQYSPPLTQEFGSQYQPVQHSSSIQVSPHDIPHLLISQGGTQTTEEIQKATPTFDDSGIQGHLQTVSPSLSAASSSETQPNSSPFVLSGADFIRKLNDQRTKATSALTVTQFTDGHHYLPVQDSDSSAMNSRSTHLERSADSGILVDDHLQQVSCY